MKSRRLLLITVVIFGLLLGGLGILQTQGALPVTARINPPFYSMEDPIPEYFTITLSGFPGSYTPEDVDPDTILVGGLIEMAPVEDWPKIGKNTFKFKVFGDGYGLMYSVVLPQVWHMQYPPLTKVDVDLLVEGEFYDDIPFEGTCTLTVMTEKEELDPLPP